jgi:response regulator of citrate/malate metabolism
VVVVDGRLVRDLPATFVAPLRERDSAVEIFVVVALDEKALVRAALRAGATGALLRPVLLSQLVRILAPDDRKAEDASRHDSAK